MPTSRVLSGIPDKQAERLPGDGRPKQPPELPRDAGIRRRRGAPGFVDRYNRDAATCRANEALALQHADDLARIWTSLDAGELLLGREVGHAKLLNRLNLSARCRLLSGCNRLGVIAPTTPPARPRLPGGWRMSEGLPTWQVLASCRTFVANVFRFVCHADEMPRLTPISCRREAPGVLCQGG